MFHFLTIMLTLASLVGVILNIKKNSFCFKIWVVTNFAWFVVDLYKGIYAQAGLFFVYFLLAIYGIIEWRKTNGSKRT